MNAPARVPADWPCRQHSRGLRVGTLDWHVQVAGAGPTVLLLHGTGGSAHSWAGLVPALAAQATVVAPDLPGHGFTLGAELPDLRLPRMAEHLQALLVALGLSKPALIAGHSAGAALALQMALQFELQLEMSGPQPELSKSPRVLGFAPSLVAPPAAYTRYLAPLLNPVATANPVARLMARVAGPSGLIDLLLSSTGSKLTAAQRAPYQRLFADPKNVRGALGFMAAADLPALNAQGFRLTGPLAFVLGERDHWIPQRALRPIAQRHWPQADIQAWPGGHLAHEEDPARAAARVLALLNETP